MKWMETLAIKTVSLRRHGSHVGWGPPVQADKMAINCLSGRAVRSWQHTSVTNYTCFHSQNCLFGVRFASILAPSTAVLRGGPERTQHHFACSLCEVFSERGTMASENAERKAYWPHFVRDWGIRCQIHISISKIIQIQFRKFFNIPIQKIYVFIFIAFPI